MANAVLPDNTTASYAINPWIGKQQHMQHDALFQWLQAVSS
jgi:hypothetical protein